jgi:hypothetical protein
MIKLKETDSVVKMNAQKRCNECKDKKEFPQSGKTPL